MHVHETRFAVGMNQSNDPLTDGLEVTGDIVFICRVPTVIPVRILSVGVVLKSNHSEKYWDLNIAALEAGNNVYSFGLLDTENKAVCTQYTPRPVMEATNKMQLYRLIYYS